MPNAAAYQVVKLFHVKGKYAIKLASSVRNRWNGELSVVDQNVNQVYDQNLHDITLSKSFIMPFEDFKKLFGLMLITPMNYKQFMATKHTGYVVDVPAGHHKAQYFRFIVREEGKVDLSIIQSRENLVPNIPKTIVQQTMNRSNSVTVVGGPQMPRPISPLVASRGSQSRIMVPPSIPPPGPPLQQRPLSPALISSNSRINQMSSPPMQMQQNVV